jgi:hypothetical protein
VLLALAYFASASSTHACSVPVFRYALERWPADPYEVVIFHRGPLKEETKSALAKLEAATHENGGIANLELATVNLDDNPELALQKLWEAQENAELPWMVVRYPRTLRRDETVWATRLTDAAAQRLLQSPLRSKVADLLLKGETGVWILLESGDRTKDDAAAELLRKQLKKMTQTLKLPELNKNDPDDRITRGPGVPDLKVSFALLRLSRTDPAEQALVQMLLHAEDDLITLGAKPMAFPIFGRGRAHFALVGDGIVASNIEESCTALVGPCTCQVKRLYPGTDLLLAADWDKVFRPAEKAEAPQPPTPSTTLPPKAAPEPAPPAEATANIPGAADDVAEPVEEGRLHWLWLTLLICGGGTFAVFALAKGMWPRS